MENSEINGSGTTPARSAQSSKKKAPRKTSSTITSIANVIKTEISEITESCSSHNFPAATQSVQLIKKPNTSKPSTAVNAMEISETIDSGTAPSASAVKPEIIDSGTASTQSAQPIIERSAGSSRVVNAGGNAEAIEIDAAPSTSAQPKRKKSARKPKVVKRIYRRPLKNDHFKSPRPVLIPVASQTLSYKNSYFSRGDIVSVVDNDSRVYYAQIRGLLENQYSEKSAVLTWLLPTTRSPRGRFDPQTYIFGHEEDVPRDLEYLEFVCHAPSDYFKLYDSYPRNSDEPVLGFAETRKGYVVVRIPCEEFSTDSE